MTRAVVWKGKSGRWWVDVCDDKNWRAHLPLDRRALVTAVKDTSPHPTHQEALDAALAAVGLLRDGNPHTPCGRGPCALGDQHQGACQQ